MKRNRKMQFPGDHRKNYYCSLSTYFKAQSIILKLWIKRQLRRIKNALQDCKSALLVIPLWAIFVLLTYYWGNSIGKTVSFMDVLWEYKASFFTSVLIVAFLSIASGFEKRHNSLIQQHKLYCRTMDSFSDFAIKGFEIFSKNSDYKDVPFWPFYEENSFELLHNEFEKIKHYNLSSDDIYNLCTCIKELHRCLLYFSYEDLGRMAVNNSLRGDAQNLIDLLDCFDRDVLSEDHDKNLHEKLLLVIEDMYKIIESIRSPWRKDIDDKISFLRLVYADNNSMGLSYYDEALLNIVDYEWYRNSSDRDYLLKRLFEHCQNEDKSRRKKDMCTIEFTLDEYERIMNYEPQK